MSDLEDQFVTHVQAIEDLCDKAGEKDPGVKEALDGHLETALDALDDIQDVLAGVADEAVSMAEGAGAGGGEK